MKWEWNFRRVPIRLPQLAIVAILILLSFWAQTGFNVDRNHLLFFISNYSLWLLLLPFIFELSKRIQHPYLNRQLILGACALIIIHWISSNLVLYLLRYLVGDPIPLNLQEVRLFLTPSLASRVIDLGLFTGLFSWLHQQQALTTQKVLMAENEALLERSKLQSLKNQLNPHFLFNALHSVNTLISTDHERASEMIVKVSQLLRSMLAMNERDEHTVRAEVDFVQQYLDIEAERFKDRLSVELVVQEDIKMIIIPTMTLQPLVENAFKHGISKMTNSTTLSIDIKQVGNTLKLLIRNDLPPMKGPVSRNGIGLTNLADRLKTYYQERAQLETKEYNQCFEALITIDL